jgi:antitoxin VapB
MTRSTVFMTNRGQAVRLPKAMALPEGMRQVEITKIGNSRIISPAGESWDAFFAGSPVSDDFMVERDQRETQDRGYF